MYMPMSNVHRAKPALRSVELVLRRCADLFTIILNCRQNSL
jgi:hypothetical protein